MSKLREELTPMADRDLSMFGKIEKHDERLEQHEELIDAHTIELRLQAEKIKQIQNDNIRLENVVMAENRETRTTITSNNQQLHDLINNLMGYKTGENQLTSNLKMARYESIAKIIGILAGSGGILYYIIT